MIPVDLPAELIRSVRTRLEDDRQRLITTMLRMSPEDLAWRPNLESNSAGNLVVHICGNLRQRLHAGIAGATDDRDRDAEFATAGPWTSEELAALVERTFSEVDAILAALPTMRLGDDQDIRGRPTTVLDVLIRVAAHAAEHLGQIIYIAKARQGGNFDTLSIPRAKAR